jgi:ribonuclease Z
VAIVVNDTPYIVDFGPGVVRRAAAAYRNGIKALKVSNLKIAFLTHLHSDHTVGYPDLIFTPWVLGRQVPLEVYGPPGLNSMTEHILKAYEKDIDVRLNGLEPANTDGWKVNAHEIKPGTIYEDANVTVTAFPVKHGNWDYAFGFRFETADRVIVISGDCVPSPTLIKNSKGCDVLVHEVYSAAAFEKRSPIWQRYHADSHTSTLELGKIAAQVKPRLLILYHQLSWGATPEEMLAEIKQFYDGKVVYGSDLEVY